MQAERKTKFAKAEGFSDTFSHLQAELQWLDSVIERRVHSFRQSSTREAMFVGADLTSISDPEIDWLLHKPHSYSDGVSVEISQKITALRQQIMASLNESKRQGINLPLLRLVQYFDLSWLELNIILLCLAPELRRKYDRIYAYLQDDISRKRPSLDLALELFVDNEQERWYVRSLLGQDSALFLHGLLQVTDDNQSPSGSSGLSTMLRLDPRILQFIMGSQATDSRLLGCLQRVSLAAYSSNINSAAGETLLRQVEASLRNSHIAEPSLFHLVAPGMFGQRELVQSVCSKLGRDILLVDARALLCGTLDFNSAIQCLLREAFLQQVPLFIENIDDLLTDDSIALGRVNIFSIWLGRYAVVVFTSASISFPAAQNRLITVHNIFQQPAEVSASQAHWSQALAGLHFSGNTEQLISLTERFQLGTEQIDCVAKQLRLCHNEDKLIELDELARSCRNVSQHNLGKLATAVKTQYQWGDLILSAELTAQLKGICAQVRYRRQVFDDWGFAKKLPYGRGLGAMFTGSPGTGKTMAAQVLASDLGLDLFKIDLSCVVSKYIGETEKNLSRLFSEAKSSNAILFFDEADALFGKRTDVGDAHDRYANIEVSYLLQKMEEYDGIVIMATNFRSNIDDAFVRRIRFILEFPFPDKDNRREIWQRSLPSDLPRADDIDFDWLAERVKVSGGNIKNIVLNAAFSAAQNDAVLSMEHLLYGSQQEFSKIGKLWDTKRMNFTSTERS